MTPSYNPTWAHLNRPPGRRLRSPFSRPPWLGPRLPSSARPRTARSGGRRQGCGVQGPESLCFTRYSTVRKEPRTPVCRKMPVAIVLGGPRAKSCQYVKGRGFGSERRDQELRVWLRHEKEEGPGAQLRKKTDFQLRIPSGTLGHSSSRRGGGATSFGLLRR